MPDKQICPRCGQPPASQEAHVDLSYLRDRYAALEVAAREMAERAARAEAQLAMAQDRLADFEEGARLRRAVLGEWAHA